jgi:transcriptional regulator with XRE-family HTH domain
MIDRATRTHDQEVGAKLRELRLRYVLKQEELAQALGVKHAAISRWESGVRGLTVDMLLTIAERFGIPASELLPERHQAPSPPPPTSQRPPEDAAVNSIVHVLRERPDLVLRVMEFIEQQTVSDPTDVPIP